MSLASVASPSLDNPLDSSALGELAAPSGGASRLTALRHLRTAPALEPPCEDELIPTSPRSPGLRLIVGGQITELPPLELAEYQPDDTETPPDNGFGYSFARQTTASSALPDAKRHVLRLTQGLLEALAGVRPLQQLSSLLHESVYFDLCGRRTPQSRPRIGTVSTAHVRHARITEPADGVVEASVVAMERGYAYAIAVRLEGLDGRWQCTHFEII